MVVVDVLGTVPKGLGKRLEELEMRKNQDHPTHSNFKFGFGLVWFGLVLWHIKYCRLLIQNPF